MGSSGSGEIYSDVSAIDVHSEASVFGLKNDNQM